VWLKYGGSVSSTVMSTLIKASWVVGFDGERHRLIMDGEVADEGDRIVYVGRNYEGKPERVIEAKGRLVTPGLINIHAVSSICITHFRIDGVGAGGGLPTKDKILDGLRDPVLHLSGGDYYCREVKELSPTTETAIVKHGMGRYVARNRHPEATRKIIAEGVKKALRRLENGEIVPVELPDPPYRLEMRYSDTGAADAACWMPGTRWIDGRTTLYEADDVPTVYKAFYCQTRLQRTRLL